MNYLVPRTFKRGVRDAVLDTIRETGVALGTAAAGSRARKKKNTPSTRKRKRVPSLLNEARGLTSRSMATTVSQPLSSSTMVKNLDSSKIVRVPFDTCCLPIYSGTGGTPFFGGISSGINNLSLDPNNIISGTNPFGSVTNIAGSFRRYRFVSLEFEYVPMVASSTAGSLIFACVDDGGLLSTSGYTANTIATCYGSIAGPVWNRFKIPACFDKSWNYIQDATSQVTPGGRQTAAGTLLMGSPVSLAASSFWGYLHCKGILEFYDSTPILTTINATASSSSSSSCPSLEPLGSRSDCTLTHSDATIVTEVCECKYQHVDSIPVNSKLHFVKSP